MRKTGGKSPSFPTPRKDEKSQTGGVKASEGGLGHVHLERRRRGSQGSQGSWGHRWSNTELFDLRLERNLGWNQGCRAGDVDGQPVSGLDASGGWREMAGGAKSWLLCISCTLEVYPFQVQVGRVNVCSSVYETCSDEK